MEGREDAAWEGERMKPALRDDREEEDVRLEAGDTAWLGGGGGASREEAGVVAWE